MAGSAGLGAGSGGGTGGSAGSAGAGGGAGGAPDAYSCTPGAGGNGIQEQPGPYERPPEAYPIDTNPHGTLSDEMAFTSTLYEGHQFPYRVYVPAQYVQGTPVPLMVVYDGATHFIGVSTDAKYFVQHVLDNLIAAGDVPPMIALLIDACAAPCEPQRQMVFDTPDEKLTNFLIDEIIPSVITSQYDIIMDRDAWTMVGYSGGGMQAFAAAWYHPELFGKVVTENGSFLAGKANGIDFEALINQNDDKNLRVHLLSGTGDIVDDRGNWLEANTAIANALIAKGNQVRMMSGSGGHYPPDQAAADFPNALRWMFDGCPTTF